MARTLNTAAPDTTRASIKNYRQSPRKVRLVTDLVKGKTLDEAMTALTFLNKRAAGPITKLIRSAAATAEKNGQRLSDIVIANITVDKGIVMKRSMPRAFGSAKPIRHRTSHVQVILAPRRKHSRS